MLRSSGCDDAQVIEIAPSSSLRFPWRASWCIEEGMAHDWDTVKTEVAKLVAAAGVRRLSEEESAKLLLAVDLLCELERELKKKRPSMTAIKRLRGRVSETVARFAHDAADQDEE